MLELEPDKGEKMTPIIHQQPPTDTTCTSACIAMVLNEAVNDIVSEFHRYFFAGKTDTFQFLSRHLPCKMRFSVQNSFDI